MKSFWIELLAVDFLKTWSNRGKSKVYYDWMVRDFLSYLKGKKNAYLIAPGTGELMNIGDAWFSKANMAHGRAEKACELETAKPGDAGTEWQKIFGTDISKNA
jgi:hypothetical protein